MNRTEIEKKIGYVFSDGALLTRAFTHSSADPHPGRNYQGLEFLGDSVLGLIVSRRLFSVHPSATEGMLTKMRALVVSEPPLARAVTALGIADGLILGESEKKQGVGEHDSIKCDLFEALTAAIYLDGGEEAAERFVLTNLDDDIAHAHERLRIADAKSRLNEYAMKKGVSVVYSEEKRSGADHAPKFLYSVSVGGEKLGAGSGSGKREAQQHAAEQALVKLASKHNKK